MRLKTGEMKSDERYLTRPVPDASSPDTSSCHVAAGGGPDGARGREAPEAVVAADRGAHREGIQGGPQRGGSHSEAFTGSPPI